MTAPNIARIPAELRDRPQWVVWRQEMTKDGKPTKVPYQPRRPQWKASSTKPDTWGTFEQSLNVAKINGFGGVGYVFSPQDDYAGVDFDHCRDKDTGQLKYCAQVLIDYLSSYVEISPSGTGIHVLIRGKVPPGGNAKGLSCGGKLEMYSQGRYFTMTGAHLLGTPATTEPRQAELEGIHREIFEKAQDEGQDPPKDTGPLMELSDRELIEQAHQGAKGQEFTKLWRGDWSGYHSQSEADAALLFRLAFWTGKDAARMDRLFRQSGLMRAKFDRPQSGSSWGALEIQKAIGKTTETYRGRRPARTPETGRAGKPALKVVGPPGKPAPAPTRPKGGAKRKTGGQTQCDPQRQEEDQPTRIPWVGHSYCVKSGRLCKADYDGKKWEYRPLANFQARIEEEVTRDDGLRPSKEFHITGSLDTGRPLPLVQVPARDFDNLSWIRREWGAAAAVAPGRSHAPHLVNAIQSHSGGFKRRTVYAHTGWRKINGVWRYLHGGGAIGQGELVEVDLGENLGNYRLPEPGGKEAAQASLRFLDLAPWEIMAPLISCAYLAVFADLLKIDFSLWIYGETGGFKSTLAALALSHYGNFNRLTLPGSWFSTENSLEKLTFVLKDSLVVIDDFIPASTSKESYAMSAKAGRLIYQAGNRSSRGRLAPDLTARPNHTPRGLIISTAEILLSGQRQSATARYLGVELDPKKTAIDNARLTAAQKEAHFYAGAMAAYLESLAPRLDDTLPEIKELWEGYRTAYQSTAHLRIPEIQAWLAVGFELFLRFQTIMGTITQGTADKMLDRAWWVFEALGEKHSRIIEGERPTLKFLAILRELFYQKRIYVESTTLAGVPPPAKEELGWEGTEPAKNAELVGWADNGALYLMPEMTFKVVNETIHRQGDYFSLGKNDLLAALARDGFIEPSKDGENTKFKWIQGTSKRIICLPLAKIFRDEALEDEEK